LGIPGLFDVEMGGLAYHAIADLLLHFNQRAPAEEMCRKALELLDETKALEQFKARVLMAKILLKRGHAKKAYELVASISDKLDTEGIPPVVKRAALVTKARVELRRHDKAGAAKSYAEARAADPSNLTAGDVLEEELDLNYKDYKEEEYRGVIATLKAWTPLEKLAFLTWDYEDMADGRHDMLLDVAATTGEVDYMIKVYEEAIKYLDNVNAGAPLRLWLVKLYLHVTEDLERARKALDEIFGSTSTGWPYAVTDEAPDYTLEEALSVQSNVMFQLFMASSDPVVKRELLESAKGLTTRPLALAVPPDSDTFILDYRINVARMHLKMGPAEEFQRLMQKIIDACIEALADKVGWNDSRNLVSLGQALFILAKAVPDGEELMRVAKIFSSARFSHLSSSSMSDDNSDRGSESGSGSDTESDYSDGSEGSNWSEGVSESKSVEEGATGEGDKGDAHERVDGKEGDEKTPTPDEGDMGDPDQVEWSCDGRCIPTLTYAAWEGRIAYQCHTCVAFLCPGCYEALIAHNRGETPIRGRKYCGKDHEYIKLPIEGWRGIEDGIIHIDGEEDIPFTDLLTKVKDELCKKAWDSFWRGE
jgi:tetratricopeptide (TPR) repeat protein